MYAVYTKCTLHIQLTFEVIHILFPGSHFFGNWWLSTENSFYYFDTTPNHSYLITPTLHLTWIDHHFFVLTYCQATVKEKNKTEAILEVKWCHYCKLTRCPVNLTVKRVVWPHNSLLLAELPVATNTHLPTIEGFMRELILQISFIILQQISLNISLLMLYLFFVCWSFYLSRDVPTVVRQWQ